jgi:hypothetical protein
MSDNVFIYNDNHNQQPTQPQSQPTSNFSIPFIDRPITDPRHSTEGLDIVSLLSAPSTPAQVQTSEENTKPTTISVSLFTDSSKTDRIDIPSTITDNELSCLVVQSQTQTLDGLYQEIDYSEQDAATNTYTQYDPNCNGETCVMIADDTYQELPEHKPENNKATMQDVITMEHYLNLGLDIIRMRHADDSEIAKQVGGIVSHELANSRYIQENFEGQGKIILDTLGNYLAKGKVRVEDFGAIVLQTQVDFGLSGVRDLITAIVKHESLAPAVKQILMDIITYLQPEVVVITMAIQAIKSLKAIATHYGTELIHNLPVRWMDKPAFKHRHFRHEVHLHCDLLDIHMHKTKKHIDDAKKLLRTDFDKEVKRKVFSILGIDYDDLDAKPNDTNEDTRTRYEKTKDLIYHKTIREEMER